MESSFMCIVTVLRVTGDQYVLVEDWEKMKLYYMDLGVFHVL